MPHDLSDQEWELAFGQVRPILEAVVLERDLIAYGDLSQRIEGVDVHPFLHGTMASLLAAVQEEDHAAGRPLLPAVVVRADTHRPGAGFYAGVLAHAVSIDGENSVWEREIEAVYRYYARVSNGSG